MLPRVKTTHGAPSRSAARVVLPLVS